MKTQKYKDWEQKAVTFVGIPLVICFMVHTCFFEESYVKSFAKKTFKGVVTRKIKDWQKPDSYWYLTLQDMQLNSVDTTLLTFPNLKYAMKGFENFYDYLQIGDTVYKIKDSLVVEVKNGARYKVFRGEEKME